MSNHLDGDIISPQESSKGGVIRAERVWQHRHDLEIRRMPKPRYNRSSLLTLGIGGLVLGAVCMFAYSDPGPIRTPLLQEATASHPVDKEHATIHTTLPDIVDTAPAPTTANVTGTQVASLPYAVIPTKRPVIEPVKSGGSEKVNDRASTPNSTEVLRYDRCNPACDTRDPLVVGATPTKSVALQPTVIPESTDLERSNQAVEIGSAVMSGAGFVLVQTAALPFTTLKLGRDAAIRMSKLD
ncbi:hypothetical protein G6L67_24690 [Agrobacterium tumefaciens]|nr:MULTISPECIES: hypothetical protein [Rhizobium/Agrobacterium group]AYM84832.1 hypothetical protein At12D1_49500 [Agrobacterium tumefaciens]NTE95066.1 hypothetical protein [Agrobacterium tumefaciens]QCL10724.1 hypothetical protein pOC-C5.8_548 [Rhizobium rhizogenes]QCL98404.1 hypothetical protein CFBP7129_29935 [Agrobacterium tumefaciens]CUX68474.1 conserved hypothetical protein [Agrobacterium tumefaciens str. Kerr 14]